MARRLYGHRGGPARGDRGACLGGPTDYLLRVVVADTQGFDDGCQQLLAGVTLRSGTLKIVMEVAHHKPCLRIADD